MWTSFIIRPSKSTILKNQNWRYLWTFSKWYRYLAARKIVTTHFIISQVWTTVVFTSDFSRSWLAGPCQKSGLVPMTFHWAEFREVSKHSFLSLNCHFWKKITKMVTRVNSRIFTKLPYIWIFKYITYIAIIEMIIFKKII